MSAPDSHGAADEIVPQPEPEPLGVLVNNSKTIHVLEVAEIGVKGLSFKTTATLKGKPEEVPFRLLQPFADCKDLFHVGDPVLCFFRHDGQKAENLTAAALFVRGCWILAYRPALTRSENTWYCVSEFREDCCGVTYEGTTENLRKHAGALVAGRETTITAQAPQTWDAVGKPRRWRIKAGPAVTGFVLSEDSPHFVGWGDGDPEIAATWVKDLDSPAPDDRIAAAANLAHQGADARPAFPALRRALDDRHPAVSLTAARALARLGQSDEAVVPSKPCCVIRTWIDGSLLPVPREMGPAAHSTLPDLPVPLADTDAQVRADASRSLGTVAVDAPGQREAVGALIALLQNEQDELVRIRAVESLQRFGPQAWAAEPALRQELRPRDNRYDVSGLKSHTIALLARFDPPPVKLGVALAEHEQFDGEVRRYAAEQLEALGPRARAAVPALRRLVRQVPEAGSDFWEPKKMSPLEAAEALLAIDPEGAPAVLVPVCLDLLKRVRPRSYERLRLIRLLGQDEGKALGSRASRCARPGGQRRHMADAGADAISWP